MTWLKIKRLDKELPMPKYAKEKDSGMDLMSTINHTLIPGEVKVIPTGISIELPDGYEAQIRSRSGLSIRDIYINNSPGTVDNQFRGEVCAILKNDGNEILKINRGDRICQLAVCPVEHCIIQEVNELSDTERGDGAFGHTGI